jgi:hypothetical protein
MVIVFALDRESGWGASICLASYIVLLSVWGNVKDIAKWAIDHPFWIVGIVFGYVILGAVWGVLKWILKVRKMAFKDKERYQQLKKRYCEKANLVYSEPIPVTHQKDWAKAYKGSMVPLQIREHKSTFILWMAFWPLSAAWSMIDDLFKEVYEIIYRNLSTWLQKLSDNAYRKVIALIESDLTKD